MFLRVVSFHFGIVGELLLSRTDNKAAILNRIMCFILEIIERTYIAIEIPLNRRILCFSSILIIPVYLDCRVIDSQIIRMRIRQIHRLAFIETELIFIDVNDKIIQPIVTALPLCNSEGAGLFHCRHSILYIMMVFRAIPHSSISDFISTAVLNGFLGKGIQGSLVFHPHRIIYFVVFVEGAVRFPGQICCCNGQCTGTVITKLRSISINSVVQQIHLRCCRNIIMSCPVGSKSLSNKHQVIRIISIRYNYGHLSHIR